MSEERRAQPWFVDPLIVLALLICLWPVTWPTTRLLFSGADGSYGIGLHLAAQQHLVFGRDIVFTYGPLGFLDLPLLVTPVTGVLAILVSVASRAALIAAVWTRLHAVADTVTAVIATYLFIAVASVGVYVLWFSVSTTWLVLAAFWAVAHVTRDEPDESFRTTLLATIAASVTLLVKLDSGIAILTVVAVACALVAFREGGLAAALRHIGVVTVAAPATVALAWILIGQPLSALPDWLHGSVEILSGFARDMGWEDPSRHWQYGAAALAVVALVVAIATASRLIARRRVDAVVVVLVTLAFAFRQGFVRHDLHAVEFFAVVAFLPVAFVRWWPRLESIVVSAGLALLVLAVAHGSLFHQISPTWRVARAGTTTRLLVSPSERNRTISASRASLRRAYAIPRAISDRLERGSVHVRGTETGVVFAYDAAHRWDPLPVFQDYQAYTAYLDRLNARKLRSRSRPTYVLTGPSAVKDDRLLRWESPAETVQLLCGYDLQLESSDHQWLLSRAGADHCGPIMKQAPTKEHLTRTVVSPTGGADRVVLVRFSGIATTPEDRVRTAVFKGPNVYVHIANRRSVRFAVGTQSQWHVVSAPPCARVLLDGDFPPNLSQFSLGLHPGNRGPRSAYTAQFAVMSYRCPAPLKIVGPR